LKDYSIHPIVSGETLYSLERKYGVTHEEMLKLNPALQNGLKSGMKLKIPVQHDPQVPASEKNDQSYIKYKVENGETIFSLSSRFGIEAGELKKANPSLLSRSLESGEIILIPQNSTAKNTIAVEQETNIIQDKKEVSSTCNPISGNNMQKYRVGLLLPLNLPGNDKVNQGEINKAVLLSKINFTNPIVSESSDTSLTVNGVNIDQKAEGFIEFYEGALLAIDSLQRKGMNIELFVFDVTNQEMVNAILQLEEFRDLNLIIGPVYPELQESVASFAAKNRIPMISPLSSAGNYEQNNSWYFKVNPTKEVQLEQTATYIADEFSKKNFFLLQQSGNSSSADAQLANLCKEKLANRAGKNLFHEYNFQENGVNSIKPLMDENGENIFVIPTDNEAQVSVAVTNLTALAEHYNIVLMGTPMLIKLKSIQTENYHRIRLRYLSPYFIDYSKPLVRRFVGNYRETFSAEPSQFSFQGFDVSYYFLSALFKYGKDFRSCLPNYPMELTQMVFNFAKVSPMGGSMNHGMFVTGYERNFDVVNYGIVGEQGKK
jgi:LysM repeat protein/ABC-type branched-subunit amino acid transport system substrate-binding protein